MTEAAKNVFEKATGGRLSIMNTNTQLIENSSDPALDDFYKLYSTIFTLESERESKEGFAECLDLNHDADLQKTYGPFKEVTLLVRDDKTNDVIGAANFIMIPRPADKTRADWGGLDALAQSNYIFVHPDHRNRGVASFLLDSVEKATRDYTREVTGRHMGTVRVAQHFEQNDPRKMTFGDYKADSESSGIDQCERLLSFQRMGARRLDFNYAQPALEEGGEVCDYLMLTVRKPEGTQITKDSLSHYLTVFISGSVLKGRPASEDPTYQSMIAEIVDKPVIRTFDDRKTLPVLKQEIHGHMAAGVSEEALIGEVLADDRNRGSAPHLDAAA